jgi:ketosteroid isomerase-like protein
MTKALLRIQSPDEAEVVFYEAFMRGDIEVMSALWADDDVVCVHPGSGIISGYESVMRSWRHILEDSHGVEIRYNIMKKTQTDSLAVHVVAEEIIDNSITAAIVISTNVYRRFKQGWMIVEHHGSVIQQERKGETLQ